ncbi:MAG: peptidoglycan-binding protein [Patescibacteria group bacterium]
MKKILITILPLLLPVMAFAATNDFVANGNITVAGVTFGASTADMLILSGSESESWLFSSGAFTVTNPGSAFQVGSSDSAVKSIQVSQSGTTLACSENTTPGTSAVTLPTTSGTYTVSPSATTQCTSLCTALSNTASYNSFPTCGAASCNAGYRLSGSGGNATCVLIGGGGSLGHVGSCNTGYILSGGACRPITSTPDTTTSAATAQPTSFSVFLKNLSLGTSSEDVRRLQILLASDKDVYPEGTISGYYGPLTQKAVGRFQVKYGVATPSDAGYGNVGPKTRAKLQEVFGGVGSVTAAPAIPTSSGSASFSVNLAFGMRSSDVYRLQQILATDSEVYPNGTVSGYFGQLTREAVQKFQIKHGVVSSDKSVGYGSVGPKTRTKLQEVFGK